MFGLRSMSESIRYKGKTYKSLAALHKVMAAPEITYAAFRARIKRGWPIQKALTRPKGWKPGKIRPLVDGKQYSSLMELANTLKISYNTVYRRGRRGWSDHEIAYGRPRKRKRRQHKSRRDWLRQFEIVFQGKTYKNRADLCHAFGVKPTTFRNRHNKRGYSLEQALGLEPIPDKRKKQYHLQGKTYDSKKAFLSAFNIREVTFDDRVKRGYTLAQAVGLESVTRKRQTVSLLAKKIVVDGHEYQSHEACRKAFGISSSSLSVRLKNGWTPEEAVGLVERKGSHIRKRVTCDGVEYPSISALAKAFDLPYWKVRRRIIKYAYTPEQAVGLDGSRQYLQETTVGGKVYRSD